ncbi:putative alcohol dehydrogenase [Xylaria curta]|nr:putative alcohol dehydrogenase [Xylaria curta]
MASADVVPLTQTAVIAGQSGDFEISNFTPVPSLEPTEILIRTKAVALNPVDAKLVGDFVTPGCIYGFDCCGEVVAIGKDVRRTDLKIGDRVCGSGSGMNKEKPLYGAFAEYVKFPEKSAFKVSDNMSTEDAAALGTPIASACMVLFWSLGWPLSMLETTPEKPLPKVLVYGGSTSSGTMVLQLLRLCGVRTITTCSPHNFDLVKSYGADEVYDYKDAECAAKIRADTGNTLEYAIDCVAEDSSMRFCYAALGRVGGKYVALNPFDDQQATRKVIEPDWILATRIDGAGSSWPPPFACDPSPELEELSVSLFAAIQQLLNEDKLRSHPVRLEDGGLSGLLNGIEILRKGGVSGQKLVYSLA